MTSTEFKAGVKALGWKYEEASKALGKSVPTIKRYATGSAPIPDSVVQELASLLPRGAVANPEPAIQGGLDLAGMSARADVKWKKWMKEHPDSDFVPARHQAWGARKKAYEEKHGTGSFKESPFK